MPQYYNSINYRLRFCVITNTDAFSIRCCYLFILHVKEDKNYRMKTIERKDRKKNCKTK